MQTKLHLNDLLYIEEHLSCNNYLVNVRIGFKYFEFTGEEKFEENRTDKNYLMFFLKGDFKISCNQFLDRWFHEGEMILIPKSSLVEGAMTKGAQMVSLYFDVLESPCDKLIFQSLAVICDKMKYDFSPLEIRHPLTLFLEMLTYFLKNGMNCHHIHDLMQREFFLLLRGFYKKEEIALLFHPIIGKELDFKDFIIQNYLDVNSIDELISLSHMGRTSFYTKFRSVFGVTAKQWMLKQMNQRILGMVVEPGISIKKLMEDIQFESQAHLNRHFKKYFGCTPKQLIDRQQSK